MNVLVKLLTFDIYLDKGWLASPKGILCLTAEYAGRLPRDWTVAEVCRRGKHTRQALASPEDMGRRIAVGNASERDGIFLLDQVAKRSGFNCDSRGI